MKDVEILVVEDNATDAELTMRALKKTALTDLIYHVKDGVEAVTNIYQDSKSIFAYGGTIESTFAKIRSKISQYSWSIEPTTSTYGVSESSFASTPF